jgi:hypothetical protein
LLVFLVGPFRVEQPVGGIEMLSTGYFHLHPVKVTGIWGKGSTLRSRLREAVGKNPTSLGDNRVGFV